MKKYIITALCAIIWCGNALGKAPKLTVVIMIDQFAAHFIPKLKPHLSGGIRFLSEEGTSYVNTFYDHSMPGTGPGHTLFSTGTFATFHGIVNNSWFDKDGKKGDVR